MFYVMKAGYVNIGLGLALAFINITLDLIRDVF